MEPDLYLGKMSIVAMILFVLWMVAVLVLIVLIMSSGQLKCSRTAFKALVISAAILSIVGNIVLLIYWLDHVRRKKPVPVFRSVTEKLPTKLNEIGTYHRIPAIVQHKDKLFAFCEKREHFDNAGHPVDLVCRRGMISTDGVTWESNTSTVVNLRELKFRAMNPVPIVDEETGHIILVFTAYPISTDENKKPETEDNHLYITSSFDGVQWSDPADITEQTIAKLKIDGFDDFIYSSRPGHGTVLAPNETTERYHIVVPGRIIQGEQSEAVFFSSDNGGKSWQVETILKSNDEGIRSDVSEVYANVSFNEGAILGNGDNRDKTVMIVSNSASIDKRTNLSISMSEDAFMTWSKPYTIHKGPSIYSDLCCYKTTSQDGQDHIMIGCLYEWGNTHNNFNGIYFKAIPLGNL